MSANEHGPKSRRPEGNGYFFPRHKKDDLRTFWSSERAYLRHVLSEIQRDPELADEAHLDSPTRSSVKWMLS